MIIKSYRKNLGNQKFADLKDYAEHLFKFIKEDSRFNHEAVEEIIIYRILSDNLKRIVNEVEDKIFERDNNENILTEQVNTWLIDCLDKNIKTFKDKDKTYLDMEFDHFERKFASVINEVKEENSSNKES